MGKRKHGLLTDWQRRFLEGSIQLKASKGVSVEQRKRIELREIRLSVSQALSDLKLVNEYLNKGIIPNNDDEISKAIFVLEHFERWGKKSESHIIIPVKCKICGYEWNHGYFVGKDGTLRSIETMGTPRKNE